MYPWKFQLKSNLLQCTELSAPVVVKQTEEKGQTWIQNKEGFHAFKSCKRNQMLISKVDNNVSRSLIQF